MTCEFVFRPIGTTHNACLLRDRWTHWNKEPYISDLPTIAALNPAIARARKTSRARTGCADVPFASQGFGVNAAAALAASMLAKESLVDGQIRTAAVFFDVEKKQMIPRPITRDWLAPCRPAGCCEAMGPAG